MSVSVEPMTDDGRRTRARSRTLDEKTTDRSRLPVRPPLSPFERAPRRRVRSRTSATTSNFSSSRESELDQRPRAKVDGTRRRARTRARCAHFPTRTRERAWEERRRRVERPERIDDNRVEDERVERIDSPRSAAGSVRGERRGVHSSRHSRSSVRDIARENE